MPAQTLRGDECHPRDTTHSDLEHLAVELAGLAGQVRNRLGTEVGFMLALTRSIFSSDSPKVREVLGMICRQSARRHEVRRR